MTKQIDLILNGKGGVGKSFFATNFVQTLKDRRLTHRAVDTDDENSTLLRFHADAEFLNIEKPREIDREMARHFGRQNDLILLRVRPDGAPAKW